MVDEHLTDAVLKSMHAKQTVLEQRIEDLDARFALMERNMAANTDATKRNSDAIEQIRQNTQDIIETFQALSGGFKVLQGLGHLAKPLAYIVGCVTAIITAYSAWRGLK